MTTADRPMTEVIDRADVVALHIAILGRAPTREELMALRRQVLDGELADRGDVIRALVVTDEARSQFAPLSTEAAIARVYEHALSRSPSVAEVDRLSRVVEREGSVEAIARFLDAVRDGDPGGRVPGDPRTAATAQRDQALLEGRIAVAESFALDGPGTLANAGAVVEAVTPGTDTASDAAVGRFLESVLARVGDPPIAVDDRLVVRPGERVAVDVLANDVLTSPPGEATVSFSTRGDRAIEAATGGNLGFATEAGFTGAIDVAYRLDTPAGRDDGQVQVLVSPVPALSVQEAAVVEGDAGAASLRFAVTLREAVARDVVFGFRTTADGGATPGADYTPVERHAVTIPAGETRTTIEVPVAGDRVAERDETVAAAIELPGPDALVANPRLEPRIVDGRASATIANDDGPVPGMSIEGASVIEGDPASAMVEAGFRVALDRPARTDVTLDFRIPSTGSATPGEDFAAIGPEPITIPAGSTAARVPVPIIADRDNEADETIAGAIELVAGDARVTDGAGVVTIIDDDRPSLSIADGSAPEGGDLALDLALDRPAAQRVEARVVTSASGAAEAGVDYRPVTETVVFEPGEVRAAVTVPLRADALAEGSETFTVRIDRAIGARIDGAEARTATATIVDQPPAPAAEGTRVDLRLALEDHPVFAGHESAIRATMDTALDNWLSVLRPAADVTLELGIGAFNPLDSSTLARAGSTFGPAARPSGELPGVAASKLITGVDPNGAEPDGSIEFAVNRFDELAFEPATPDADEWSAEKLLAHELGHVFGIQDVDGRSVWDGFVEQRGDDRFFEGPAAVRANGGPVPLSGPAHIAESVYGDALMTPLLEPGPANAALNPIEVAIVDDLGFTVA